MTRTDNWTAGWACDKLLHHDKVIATKVRNDNLLELEANGLEYNVEIATMSVANVTAFEIGEIYTSNSIEFILNIKADAYYDRTAIYFSEQTPVGIGGVSDLYRAITGRELRTYLPEETKFILRGLRQHSKVTSVTRANNRTYQITRNNHDPVTVLALNEYDLTAEAVRQGIERFGIPSLILTSNPNCHPSTEALRAASNSGLSVLSWGELLGSLHRA